MALTRSERLDEPGLVALAERLARRAPAHAVVFLDGPLGAGKTTLVRALLRALGVTGAVRSPTYTLVEPYALDGPVPRVLHLDLYRLGDPEELEYLGLREEFDRALILIEWPQRGEGFLPAPDLQVALNYPDTDSGAEPTRQLTLSGLSPVGIRWLEAL